MTGPSCCCCVPRFLRLPVHRSKSAGGWRKTSHRKSRCIMSISSCVAVSGHAGWPGHASPAGEPRSIASTACAPAAPAARWLRSCCRCSKFCNTFAQGASSLAGSTYADALIIDRRQCVRVLPARAGAQRLDILLRSQSHTSSTLPVHQTQSTPSSHGHLTAYAAGPCGSRQVTGRGSAQRPPLSAGMNG